MKIKTRLLKYLSLIMMVVFLQPAFVSAQMSSTNYEIEWDSVNFGGTDDSSSASYNLMDTLGEIGTGPSSSTSYNLQAGYRQVFGEDYELSFNIRESDDSADLDPNVCDLGTLSIALVKECQYRLKIGCTFPNGYQAKIYSDHTLQVDASNDIDYIVEDTGGQVDIGQEEYGIRFTPPSSAGTGGTTTAWTEPGPYDDDDSPIPVGSGAANQLFQTTDGTQVVDPSLDEPDTYTTLVTHRAGINGTTPAGTHSQTVTYIITTNS